MKFTPIHLSGCFIVDLELFKDQRGWFARTYCKDEFKEINHQCEFIQINHSFTALKGTVRGLHFQVLPFSEIKLVRCIAGAVYDVVVDIRRNSPTYLKWFGIELSSENKKMIYIPAGFAHGFQTLTDQCELIYHHTAKYTANMESGIKFNDPAIGINWPFSVTEISTRDLNFLYLTNEFKGIEI